MKIAIDAMSAEKGIEEVIRGCEKAQEEIPDLELILVGPYGNLVQFKTDDNKISIVNAQEILRPDDGIISGALKKGRSSLVKIAELINNKDAEAGVSFTNTKWIVVIASKYLKLSYLSRTPLAIRIPSEREIGYTILLDVGGTADCTPRQLLEFGILGVYYAKHHGIENPTIGLLNNGKERTKGTKVIKKALKLYEKYADKNKEFNFVGYVEGGDIFNGKEPTVIVRDGYTGNLGLKETEGVIKFLLKDFNKICKEKGLEERMIKEIAGALLQRINPDQYGGALLLGAKPFIKGHGNSNAESIKTAIKNAVYASSNTFSPELEGELEKAIKLI